MNGILLLLPVFLPLVLGLLSYFLPSAARAAAAWYTAS